MKQILRYGAPVLVIAFAILSSLSLPAHSRAEETQSDQQCPAGGKVGQKCKDTTNGFVTQGHCTFVNECKADSFPSAPSGSPSQSPPPSTATTSTTGFAAYSGTQSGSSTGIPDIASDVINAAFSSSSKQNQNARAGTSSPFIYFDNVAYMFASGKVLTVGAPLMPDDASPPPASSKDSSMPLNAGALQAVSALNYDYNPAPTSSNSDIARSDSFQNAGSSFGGEPDMQRNIPERGWNIPAIAAEYAATPVAILAILLIIYTFFRIRRKQARLREKVIDSALLSKTIATKDSSVATPIIADDQAKTIWDKLGNPKR